MNTPLAETEGRRDGRTKRRGSVGLWPAEQATEARSHEGEIRCPTVQSACRAGLCASWRPRRLRGYPAGSDKCVLCTRPAEECQFRPTQTWHSWHSSPRAPHSRGRLCYTGRPASTPDTEVRRYGDGRTGGRPLQRIRWRENPFPHPDPSLVREFFLAPPLAGFPWCENPLSHPDPPLVRESFLAPRPAGIRSRMQTGPSLALRAPIGRRGAGRYAGHGGPALRGRPARRGPRHAKANPLGVAPSAESADPTCFYRATLPAGRFQKPRRPPSAPRRPPPAGSSPDRRRPGGCPHTPSRRAARRAGRP